MSDQPQPSPGEAFRLQQFGLKDSAYERPNQDWVCGRRDEGSPCAVGPDAKGRCVATFECRPFKKGDRWVCTRRDASTAACPCEQGPLPDGTCARPITRCSPVRSTRAKRGRFALGAFALSVGMLAFLLLGSAGPGFVSPGTLSDAHANSVRGDGKAQDCATCHAAGGNANQWIWSALSEHVGEVQNDKCLHCHLPALGRDAALPHSLPAGTFEGLAREAARRQQLMAAAEAPATQPAAPGAAHAPVHRSAVLVLASFAPHAPTSSGGELACATCHQEHGGRHHDLKAMSDVSCQVCHKQQFASFAHGHPDFHAVRHDHAGIVFNHATHEPRMPGQKLQCATCHVPDPAGRTMRFTGFEQACVGCHDQGKMDHHGDQIREKVRVVLQLPSMSVWPDKTLAPGNTLTPILQFLIAGAKDPAALHALKSLKSDVVAKGATDDDDWGADPKVKKQLVRAIEQVVKELTLDGDASALRSRVARAAGLPEQSPAVSALVDQLVAPREKMKDWQEHCLPGLVQDLGAKPGATTSPATAPATPPAAPDSTPQWAPIADNSGWLIDPAPMGNSADSVKFDPTHADAFDKSLIDVLASGAKPGKPSDIDEKMSDPAFLAAMRSQLLVQASGSCIMCHAVQPEGSSFFVNWRATGRATRVPGYLKFDHKPHVTLFQSADKCSQCHKMDPAQSAPAGLLPSGPLNHSFAAHSKALCADCHKPAAAPDTCLTCHVYHMTR